MNFSDMFWRTARKIRPPIQTTWMNDKRALALTGLSMLGCGLFAFEHGKKVRKQQQLEKFRNGEFFVD